MEFCEDAHMFCVVLQHTPAVFCVAHSGVLQDTFLWNSVRMHTCSVWFSNTLLQCSELAVKTELMLIAMWFHVIIGLIEQLHVNFKSKNKSNQIQMLGF